MKRLSAFLVLGAFVAAANIQLTAYPQTVPANTAEYSLLTAFLYDGNGSIAGQNVSFFTDFGFFENGNSGIGGWTNGTGFATARLYAKRAGNALVTAFSMNASANVTVTFYNATPTPSPSPNATPSVSPSPYPSATPSVSPSAAPSPSPIPSASPTLAPTPTPFPTATATPVPSASPSATPPLPQNALATVTFETRETLRGSLVLELNGVARQYADSRDMVAALETGRWTAVLKAEDAAGRKFISKPETFNVAAGEYRTILLEMAPAGVLAGNVFDENDAAAKNASVVVRCPGFPQQRANTDASGAFRMDFVPAGSCYLMADYEGRETNATVTVTQAREPSPVVIRFEIEVSGEGAQAFSWAAAVVLAVVLAAAFLILRRKKETPAGEGKERKKPELPSEGMRAIMQTLPERERAVVEYLLSAKGKKAAQSKIRYALLIPKTSMFRIVDALEKKKVIERRGEGNRTVLLLSEWFKSR